MNYHNRNILMKSNYNSIKQRTVLEPIPTDDQTHQKYVPTITE